MTTQAQQALVVAANEAARFLTGVAQDYLDVTGFEDSGHANVIANLRAAIKAVDAEQIASIPEIQK